jgi:hypothetical protein
VHRLADDASQLCAREGVALNRDALAFDALLKALAEPTTVDYANYAASNATRLLEDALGGNWYVQMVSEIISSNSLQNILSLHSSLS